MLNERTFIKDKLKQFALTQVWLINRLEAKGVITDKSELCSVLAGTRRGNKAETVITVSVEVLNEYERNFCPELSQ